MNNTRIVATQDWVLENTVQSDWNTNDENDLSYVKNRPFYTYFENGYIAEEQTINIANPGKRVRLNFNHDLIDGQTYIVTINNEQYECVAWLYNNSTIIGNGNLYELEGFGGDEPFCCVYTPRYSIFVDSLVVIMNEAGTYNLSIEGLIPDIHKIDEKYLPNSVKIGKPGTGAYAEIFNNYYQNVASGVYSHAEGRATIASGQSAHAEGEYSTASEMGSHAEGGGTASGQFSHAEGIGTASGNYSHAEGSGTHAIGNESHAEGRNTIASGNSSHAEGQGYYTIITLSGEASATTYNITGTINEKIKVGSIIENNNRTALATITAIDKENLTVTLSKSISSEVLNEKNCWVYCNEIASGDYSHVEGQQTIASGSQSHAEGLGTVASGESQHVHGSYNLSDTTSAHIVGNGTSDTSRSNAHTLDWDGNAWYAGDVYVGSTSGINKDDGSKKLATEEYVDNSISNIPVPDVSGQISTHNTDNAAHNDIRVAIANLNTLVGDTSVSAQIESAINALREEILGSAW